MITTNRCQKVRYRIYPCQLRWLWWPWKAGREEPCSFCRCIITTARARDLPSTIFLSEPKMVLNRSGPRSLLELFSDSGLGLGIARTVWVVSLLNASSIDMHAGGKKRHMVALILRVRFYNNYNKYKQTNYRENVHRSVGWPSQRCKFSGRVAGHLAAHKP